MKLILVRHGESEANEMQKSGVFFCGRWDCGLTAKGRTQAESLKENRALPGADAVFSSPLRRAADTAAAFADRPVIYDARIVERSLGDFEGKWKKDLENRDEYRRYFTEEPFTDFRDSFTVSAPRGEHYGDVIRRVTPFLEELKSRNYGKVIVVSHAIAIRCMIKVIRNLPEEETLRLRIDQCDPVPLEF